MGLFSKDVARPDWESEGGLTIADALVQCQTAYGPLGYVTIRIRRGVEKFSTTAERIAAREALLALGPEPRFYQEEDYKHLIIAEFRAMQDARHTEHSTWYERTRELTPVAYPFEYVVGVADDLLSYRMERSYEGKTWEEALHKANILGATKRLPIYAR